MVLLFGCVDPEATPQPKPDTGEPSEETGHDSVETGPEDTATDTSGCGPVLTAPWGEATWVTTELPDIAVALDVSADGTMVVGRNRMAYYDAIPAVWRDGVTTLWPGDAYGAAEAVLADGSWVEVGEARMRVHGPDDTVTQDWMEVDYRGADDTAIVYWEGTTNTQLRWVPGEDPTPFQVGEDEYGPYFMRLAGRYAIGQYTSEYSGPVGPAVWLDQALVVLDERCGHDCYEDVREDGTILRVSGGEVSVGQPGAWTPVAPDCAADDVTAWRFSSDGRLAGGWSNLAEWEFNRPYLWDGATFTTLPVPEGMASGYAIDVTSTGDVLGYATDAEGHMVAVLWRDGVPYRLDTLCPDPALTTDSRAGDPLGADAFLLSCDPQDASGPFLLRVSAG